MNKKFSICFLLSMLSFYSHAEHLNQSFKITTEQQSAIERISSSYLINHPEIISSVLKKITDNANVDKIEGMKKAAIENQKDLLNDKNTPSFGSENAPASVVVFFDYQCIYCSRLNPVIEQMMKTYPQMRFIFKEWPIFGKRWPESLQAAKVGLQIFKEKGSEAYLKYHNTLFSLEHNEGKLTTSDISQIETFLNFSYKKTFNPIPTLENINNLAQKIGFGGTPAIIVIPSKNAGLLNTTIFAGMPGTEQLQNAIDTALTTHY
ncbi:thioredoxin domain-containing protein [Rahnella bruchi]|uniref:thioredoxin domain-containing protein n=1 Tax=Rahnella bruchi TaxID=1510573 RepID=UPI000EA00CB5|nr:thioredoxin domain-containing protein [Rahnella bruchi]